MIRRMFRAATLDPVFYEMVEADSRYTLEAFLVVLLAAVLSGVGMVIAYPGEGMAQVAGGILSSVLGWVAWSGITLAIGTTVTKGSETQTNMGEMLRALGYSYAPQVLIFFVFIPVLGQILAFASLLWSLGAGVVAVRQALDFSTGRALATVGLGWMVVLALRGAVRILW